MSSNGQFDAAITHVLLVVAAAYAVRCVAGISLTTLGRLPGTIGKHCRWAGQVITPRLIRRLTATTMGVVVIGSASGTTAFAAGIGSPTPTPASTSSTTAARDVTAASLPTVDRGPIPTPPSTHPKQQQPKDEAAPEVIRIKSGDTLWDLASERLKPDATERDVDRLWRSFYASNRKEIGPNPDLLSIGTRLRIPITKSN